MGRVKALSEKSEWNREYLTRLLSIQEAGFVRDTFGRNEIHAYL